MYTLLISDYGLKCHIFNRKIKLRCKPYSPHHAQRIIRKGFIRIQWLLAAQRGVQIDFALADALHWTYPDESFDLVVAIFIQFAAPDERSKLFDNMKRTLKPGGRIVLQGYTPAQIEYRTGGPSEVGNLYTTALLHEAFGDLEIEVMQEYEDVLDEGLAHCGRSALIGMVARKPA